MSVDFTPLINSQPNLLRMFEDAQAQKRAEDMQKMTAYQFLRQKAEDERNDKLRGAYVIDESGAVNPKATFANLLQIDPKSAMDFNAAMEKQAQDATKRQQDDETFKLTKAEKTYNLMKQSTGYIMANPTLANATRELTRFGNMTGADISGEMEALQQIGENPEGIKQWAAGHSLSADQLLPKFQTQDGGGSINSLSIDPVTGKTTVISTTQKTASPDAIMTDKRAREEGALNRGVTIRGQNMTDARARETNAKGDKPPAGYRWAADGVTLEPIKGGPADKSLNPTETQGKAALFSSRALEADKILRSLSEEGVNMPGIIKQTAEGVPFVGGALGTTINTLPTWAGGPNSSQQKVEQAQRNFINAILRQESGAAIGESEFDNARKQYFPQPGDSKDVIKQKAKNRQTAIKGLNTMAGPLGKRGGATGDFDAPSGNVVDYGSLK